MNHGVKDSMALLLALLLTTNRARVLPNGIRLSSCSLQFGHLVMLTMAICRRTVVSIPNGPSALAVKEAAWGLARYAAVSQVSTNQIPFIF